jgi:chromosome segregation ATPase
MQNCVPDPVSFDRAMMDIPEVHHQSENPALAGLHASIKEFRDRVTRAAALIADLRRRVDELERTNTAQEAVTRELQERLDEKEFRIIELEEQVQNAGNAPSSGLSVDTVEKLLYLSPDEREALERQISDLIARIDAHLG